MAAPCRVMLSWGANSYGQIGQGNTEDLCRPIPAINQLSLSKDVIGGGGHTIFIRGDQTCVSVGWNSKGQCGRSDRGNVLQPSAIEKLPQIHRVSAGWDFTLAINPAGQVYGWGNNAWGQLGLECKDTDTPTRITEIDENVVDIACGLRHGVLLTDKGDVYTSGSGKKGQLGIVQDDRIPPKLRKSFRKVNILLAGEKITQVVAGAYHTAALSDKGRVLVWGDNKHGQLGKDPAASPQINTPEVLNIGSIQSVVSKIYSGWTHMLALTVNGELCSWGRGDYGQLGRHISGKLCYKPSPIDIKNVRQLAVGSEHNLAITEEEILYSWGWNEHGMCGTGDEVDVPTPRVVQALTGYKSILAGCGAGHSFVIAENLNDSLHL